MRLVTEAGYEGDAREQVLRDTIISGLASDKIRAKIVKEGHKVKLNWVMEIARLEVSTQQHLERMQETAKVKLCTVWKIYKKARRVRNLQSGTSNKSHRGDSGHGMSSKPSGKGRKFPFLQDTCYRCGKGRPPKGAGLQRFGHDMQGLWKERTLWKGVPQETFHKLSRSSTSFHQHCRGRGWWTSLLWWWRTASIHIYGQCPPMWTNI